MTRYAIYCAPPEGAFAGAAARWLGWDVQRARAVAQPDIPGLADDTAAPRRYGFHGTLKPPFRLARGTDRQGLARAVAGLAAGWPRSRCPVCNWSICRVFWR